MSKLKDLGIHTLQVKAVKHVMRLNRDELLNLLVDRKHLDTQAQISEKSKIVIKKIKAVHEKYKYGTADKLGLNFSTVDAIIKMSNDRHDFALTKTMLNHCLEKLELYELSEGVLND